MPQNCDTSHIYNKQEEFEDKIKPLVDEIERLCYKGKIPMFASFAIQNSARDTNYHNMFISPKIVNQKLQKDFMKQYIRIINGYKVIAPRDETEIPMLTQEIESNDEG